MSPEYLHQFLEEKYKLYSTDQFIAEDPVSIPHRYTRHTDIEIAGFLAATIAWGQRPVILKNASSLLQRMDDSPHDFIVNFTPKDLKPFNNFVHRTFNGDDCIYFMKALKHVYLKHGSLKNLLKPYLKNNNPDLKPAIMHWRKEFFSLKHEPRTEKHFANPEEGSAAKRINMFLRWMIRKGPIDFGIWDVSPAMLTCPLDVHSGRVARSLGLLKRKQNDWQAAEELTINLRKFDARDPVKYDFALFGLGVFEKFK